MKTAIITGCTGQVGSYLCEDLLSKNYKVYGIKRRSSSFNTERIDHIFNHPNLKLVYGDITDYASISNIVSEIKPDLFFNCAAQSHVRVSFDVPIYTMDATGTSVVNCLEAIRRHSSDTHFITMSSSVSGDTPIIVKYDGKIMIKNINTFSSNEIKTNYNNLECLTVDNQFNVKWSPVKYVFKHREKNLFNLRGSGGLDMKITGNHSVMILNEALNFVEKRVDELTTNEFLISFNSENKNVNYPTFDVSKYKNKQYYKNMNNQMNSITITDDLMRVIGFYVAEGNIFTHKIKKYNNMTFTFHIKETYYTKDIINVLKKDLGFQFFSELETPKSNVRRLKISGQQFVSFILEHFNTGSYKKQIPDWMYSLPKSAIIEFLRGYIGDARIRSKNEICYTSCNKSLIESICYLCKLCGIDSCITKRFNKAHLSPQKTIIKDAFAYDLLFRGEHCDIILGNKTDRTKYKNTNNNLLPSDILRPFFVGIDTKPFCKKTVSKKRVLQILKERNLTDSKYDKIKLLCESEIHIVRIKDITEVQNNEEYVYDLHVPETQRFIGGNYPVLLHNSEMFGGIPGTEPQNEQTPFAPKSIYGVAKVAGYYATINYREAYNLFASNIIAYNNESPRRGEFFVSRKITRAATRIKLGLQDKLVLGNLESKRDFSHSLDIIDAMYKIITATTPNDYVVASGETHSIRELVKMVFNKLDLNYQDYIEFDPIYLRNTEVDILLGDASKIKRELGWQPKYTFEQLIDEMIASDMKIAKQEKLIKDSQ